jgi:hypothetical protein
LRDILTFLAGLLILVLVAALAVPPLVDWTSHRALVERGIARALGQEVRTEGALDLRLLPYPRIRMQRLRIGGPEADAVSLDAMYVRAEIALTPLLAGEVRFLDTRIGRAEIKLPAGAGGDWRVPARLVQEAAQRKGWAIEDLRVEQFLLTTADPATGRTDQHAAEAVRIQAGSLLGPWRFEGRSRGLPVEIAMGEMAADRSAALKIGIGGAGMARLDLDGQLALEPGPGDILRPRLAGTAKLVAGAEGFPVQAQAGFTASGSAAELKDVVVEAGEGASAVRLSGGGRYRLAQPALSLALSGRRVDLSALRRALAPSLGSGAWRQGPPIPLSLSLKLDSLAIGSDEDLSQFTLSLSAEGQRGEVRSFEVSGPGRSRLRGEGTFWLGAAPGAAGRVSLEAADGQRLARALESLGVPGLAGFVQPEPLEAAAEMSIVDPVVSLRNLRVSQGDLRLSGAMRHTAAQDGARARLDAQLAVEGLDVSALPQAAPLFALARDRDLGLTIDARNVSHGGRKGGRITGRLQTEGSSVLVESLEVRDLAGAEANLSGRIAPNGSGRIEGRLRAPRAAPLLDLFGQAWIGGLSRLLPATIRDDSVDLRVEVEQTGEADAPSIRTALRGRLADAPFEASTRTGGGKLATFRVETEGDGLVGALPRAPLRKAGRLAIVGEREEDGRLSAAMSGMIAGLALETLQRLRLGEADDRLESGEIRVQGADAAPLLARFGVQALGPVPIVAKVAFLRRDAPAIVVTGEIAGTRLAADIAGTSLSELRGTASVDALSLPWLASVLALGPVQPASPGAVWPTSRFGPPPGLPVGGSMGVRATSMDLGLGLRGRDAAFTLTTSPTGFRASRLDLRVGEARLRGEFAIDRQEGLASLTGDAAIEGISLPSLLAPPFAKGRAAVKLRFGSSGESVAGLLAGLGGAGDVTVEGLAVDGADPGGPARLAARVLRTDDPIASQKWQPQLAEELGRGPLSAASPVTAPGALVGGALRLSPLRIEAESGSWQGAATLDFRTLSLDMRGALQSKVLPRNWSGAPPTLGLGWSGPFGRIARVVDPAPLVNGLATNVLARELDRVDTFELDAAERKRRNSREEMERQRRADEARRRREREQQQANPIPAVPPLPPPAPQPVPADPGG